MCSAPYNPSDWSGGFQMDDQQQHQAPVYYGQQDMNFASYDYGAGSQPQPQQQQQQFYGAGHQPYQPQPTAVFDPYANHPAYSGQMFVPSSIGSASGGPPGDKGPSSGGDNFEDEPPLLEELGINFDHITQKTLMVLNPLKQADMEAVKDTDLAGPLVFCLAFGGALLLTGKLHFGYIYGIGVTGCLALYMLLNMMNTTTVQLTSVMSTLGYCLLPMCLLSLMAVVVSLRSLAGIILTSLTVAWCAYSSSKLFVNALSMDHQRLLVAYPCALVYGVFALLTVF
ncbi:hypothetical protein BOX15_Mlig023227g2 [Macrostomum lignano]|nr:hypothetical protein BOX15_Mlig023227g2 [Macrostomum lignano]